MLQTEARSSPYQRLADSTTHEVRNALNAMAIHLAVLADRMSGADGTPARTVAALQSQVGRIEIIMRRFQRLASPPLEEGDADLADLVAQTVEACSHDARRHGVTVEVELRAVTVRGSFAGLTEAVLAAVLRGIEQSRGGRLRIGLAVHGAEVVLSLDGEARDVSTATAARIELRLPLAG
ncbi:MAG TPA: hypothetical protein VGK67_21600 [Myxococcales bacterium]|jgi:signal transduction histidine kinase